MKFLALTLAHALLLIAGAAGAAEPSQQLFDKVAAAYGALAPTAIRATGNTTSLQRGSGALVRLFKAPNLFRSEINYASGMEVRTLRGPLAWHQNTPANPMQRGAIVLQAARVALPWNLLSARASAIDLGAARTAQGQSVRIIELALDPQLKLVVEIETETGHLLRSRGIQSMGAGAIEFSTDYSDFRSENGRVHAGREQQFVMGQHIATSVIDKVEYPATIPDSAFMPGAFQTAQRPAVSDLLATR